jgi:outer membrane lipoprotein-sorting protein
VLDGGTFVKNSIALSAALALIPGAAFAGNPGYDLAKKVNDEASNYIGSTSDAIMTLYDGDKVTVEYKLKQFAVEGTKDNGNTTKSLIRFLAPADSKGTALLTHEVKNGSESRWLYLSETRQVKQIAGSAKSAAFKGSEFSYEDMSVDTLDKYEYKLLGEKTVNGRKCDQVERIAKYEDSGYSKSIVCFDKENPYIDQVEFYDKGGKLVKVSTVGEYKKVDGRWRSHFSEIKNVQTNKRTTLKGANIKLQQKLSDQLFTTAQLQKD